MSSGEAKQGDIWYANLNPAKGSEQAGERPVVIISGNTLNSMLPIVIVCPLSAKIKSYPTCVIVAADKYSGLKKDSEAITFQVRAVSKNRLTKKLGRIKESQLREIIKGLGEVLKY